MVCSEVRFPSSTEYGAVGINIPNFHPEQVNVIRATDGTHIQISGPKATTFCTTTRKVLSQ